jgi:predicted RNA binding protein YcfA (HicA-like mRNA interferase family)
VSKKQKRLEALRNNPKDWTIDDLINLATSLGFEVRQGGKGSHVVFTSPLGATQTIPAKRPVKSIYVKLFLEMIEMIDMLDPTLISAEEEPK